MPAQVPPATEVLTLVFLAWASGTVVGAALTRQWKEVHPGHFKVVWLVSAALSFAAGFGYRPAWAVSALCLGTFASIYQRADRVLAIVTAIAAVGVLALGTDLFLHALAAAVLLGTVTNAMLVGHWHLNQPRLGTTPIARLVRGIWLGLAIYAAAIGILLVASAPSPDTGVRVLGAVTAVAFTAFAAVLTALVHRLVKTRSIMSATGILYLEILLCFVAVFTGSIATLAGH